jgi:hypothetical protein
MTGQFLKALTTAAAALLVTAPASAATYVLNLTGTVSQANSGSFPFQGDTIQYWNLALNGLTPLTLVQGDVVRATVQLNQTLTVPATSEMFIGFNLFQGNGAVSPILPVSTSGTMTFNPGGMGQIGPVSTACGNCIASIAFLGASNAVSFGSLYTEFTIDTLTDPSFLIDGASVSYQLRDPISAVPEPATWAMMIFGFGLVGGAMRVRRRNIVLA